MPLLTDKTCYDPPGPGDGLRLLVMRFWPRGVAKTQVDVNLPDLGPSPELIRAYKDGKLDWPAFARAYGKEMAGQKAALRLLRALDDQGHKLTLLCGCADAAHCHRSLLAGLIRKA